MQSLLSARFTSEKWFLLQPRSSLYSAASFFFLSTSSRIIVWHYCMYASFSKIPHNCALHFIGHTWDGAVVVIGSVTDLVSQVLICHWLVCGLECECAYKDIDNRDIDVYQCAQCVCCLHSSVCTVHHGAAATQSLWGPNEQCYSLGPWRPACLARANNKTC